MNTPAEPIAHIEPRLEMVPTTALAPSETHIQRMRRERFDAAALAELATSIRSLGLLQPIIARPLAALRGFARYEIVAGERRWLAAQQADVGLVPVSIRELSDEDVLEVQLVENLQREGLHPIEEAEGYEALMKLRQVNADQVADLVGKSRSYVYGRLKLLALNPKARKAFYNGEIDASTALLVARLSNAKVQQEAIASLKQQRGWGQCLSYRETADFLRRNFMLKLAEATFRLDDATLVPNAGSCNTCPQRTGNQPALLEDDAGADMCTDSTCFQAKTTAARAAKRAEVEAKGGTILDFKKAEKQGYVRLDEQAIINGHYVSYREALGKKHGLDDILIEAEDGELHLGALKVDVVKALKAKGKKLTSYTSGPRINPKALKKAKIESAVRWRMLREIRSASRVRPFNLEDVRLVAVSAFERAGFDLQKRIVDAWNAEAGIEKPVGHAYVHDFGDGIPGMDMGDLNALLIDVTLARDCHVSPSYEPSADDLLRTAKRIGLDPTAIRKTVEAELGEVEKPTAAGKKAKRGK